ncbi:hypothetical protein MTO96_050740 [Rhipicephalus appendiculatus]
MGAEVDICALPRTPSSGKKDPTPPTLPTFAMYCTLATAWLGCLCVGAAMGYAPAALRTLMAVPNSEGGATTPTISADGAICLCAGSLCQWLGRRAAMIRCSLGFLVSWLWLHSADSAASLYLAHFTVGLFVGLVSLSASAYMVEMACTQALNRIGISSVHVGRETRHIEETLPCFPPTAVNVLLVHHVMFVQQFSGIGGAPPYIARLAHAAGVAMSQPAFAVLLSSSQLVMTVFSAAVMDVLGRRKVFLVSAAACVSSLFTVGAVSSWGHEKEPCRVALDIELASLVAYAIGYSIGLGPGHVASCC